MESCDLTSMNMLCTEMVSKELFKQKGGEWIQRRIELTVLRSETRRVKSVIEITSTPHCSPRLFTLEIYILVDLVDSLKNLKACRLQTRGQLSISADV